MVSVVRVPVVRVHGACHLAVHRTARKCQQSTSSRLGELAVLERTARRLASSIRGSKIPSNLLFFYILNFLPNLRPVLEPAQ
eukprot:SAG11_NODE_10539_length_823_cov_6.675414_2_plen_81_part_01